MPELGTFVLDTENLDSLVSISTVDTYNLTQVTKVRNFPRFSSGGDFL